MLEPCRTRAEEIAYDLSFTMGGYEGEYRHIAEAKNQKEIDKDQVYEALFGDDCEDTRDMVTERLQSGSEGIDWSDIGEFVTADNDIDLLRHAHELKHRLQRIVIAATQ